MIKRILITLIISFPIVAMESPFKGKKRMAIVVEDEDAPLQSSAEEKDETKKNSAQLKAQLFGPTTQLSDVPTEVQENIVNFLLIAHGPTQRARLHNAAQNLRNFAQANQAYRQWLQDPRLVKIIIQELAQKYTNGNSVEAAIAWATPEASNYVGTLINNAIVDQGQNIYGIINTNEAKLITSFNEQITFSLVNNYPDIYTFLTSAVDPNKLSWILNNSLLADGSLLTYAILHTMPEMIDAMLNLPGLDLGNNPSEVILIPLHAAVSTENIPLTTILLQKKPDSINARDEHGNTSLILAVEKKNKVLVELLLAWQATINVLNKIGISPLIAAVKNNDTALVERLLAESNINPNLQAGPPDFPQWYSSALDVAVKQLNPQMVALLLSHARTEVNREDGVNAPIHWAALNGNIAILRMLLATDAQVDALGSNNSTALMFAVNNSLVNAIKELINAGAALNLRDNDDKSALAYAREVGNQEIIDLLLKAGATE